jgi:DNA mismatch repair protein MutS2
MKDILANANQNALFLLDELGTGTDPEEGAALAMAMIDKLIEKNSMGIVNTHLSPLKSYAEKHPNIVNAAMQFDKASLSPTYQFKTGVNGESFGLVIAERNGLPSDITHKAAEYLVEIVGSH